MTTPLSVIAAGAAPKTDEDRERMRREHKAFWCDCPNQDPEDQKFYDDGKYAGSGPPCSSHHWRCILCNRVRQVG
jgi:hypothetical protein